MSYLLIPALGARFKLAGQSHELVERSGLGQFREKHPGFSAAARVLEKI